MAELKNLLVNGVERINGDLYVSGNIYGTASNAVSAAYAPSSDVSTSYAGHFTPSQSTAKSATAGQAIIGIGMDGKGHVLSVTGSSNFTASFATSASKAVSASYATNATSASWAVSASRAISASRADSAASATSATTATTASYNADGAAAKSWITSNSGNLNSATASSHTHSNKTVLDGIDNIKVTGWNDAYGQIYGAQAHGSQLRAIYAKVGLQECTPTLIETITDTRTAAGAAYKGNTVDTTLTHGRVVAFITRYAGASNATLELVSGSSTTGAKPVYFSGTTRLGTQYPANSLIFLVYDTASSGWRVHADYNTNTTYARNVSGSAFNGYTTASNIPVYAKSASGSAPQEIMDSGISINNVALKSEIVASPFIPGTGSGSAVLSGSGATATGEFAVAEGYGSTEDRKIVASGSGAHAGGFVSINPDKTSETDDAILAQGYGSEARGYSDWTTDGMGRIKAIGEGAHAEGYANPGGTIKAEGRGAHAEGFVSVGETIRASGSGAHAEGEATVALGNGAHAEGTGSIASGSYSHAEGYATITSGNYSHAEGSSSTASGDSSHAEGHYTVASGTGSHAEGYRTVTSGSYSHAEGYAEAGSEAIYAIVRARGIGSHVEGYAEALNSDSSAIIEATNSGSHAEGYARGQGSEGDAKILATGKGAHAEGYADGDNSLIIASGNGSHAEGYAKEGSTLEASGAGSHAEGRCTTASGSYSHAEGNCTIASGQYAHAEGNSTAASGSNSHVEGANTKTIGTGSHAEGTGSVAVGNYSHAEGYLTSASGQGTHAEGFKTTAQGQYSHAEGYFAKTIGQYSHAEGDSTLTSNNFEHAQGRFNATASGQIFSIGGGTANNARKNVISVITGSTNKVYVQGVGNYNGTNPTTTNDLATVLEVIEFPKIANLDYTSTDVTAGEFSLFDMQGEPDLDTVFSLSTVGNVASVGRANIWGGIITNIGDNCTITFELESGEGIKWPDNTPEIVPGKTYEFNVIEDPDVYLYGAYGILVEY